MFRDLFENLFTLSLMTLKGQNGENDRGPKDD